MTGAGARLHDQGSSTLPLLYDFEELEGELNFLTRVVALTFYPASSNSSYMTLGEVENVYTFLFVHFAFIFVILF